MRFKRDIAALSLLFTFVVGSLAAPLSHYLFMALSDAYPPFQEEVAHHQSATHHDEPASHATHHHEAASSLLEDGTTYSSAHHHQFCEYADLFATFAATHYQDTAGPFELDFEVAHVEHDQVLHARSYALFNSRAPPIA